MKYHTLNPVRHNGKRHDTGAELELDEKAAAPLLDCGAIAPVDAKEKSTAKPGANDDSETTVEKTGPESAKAETKPEKTTAGADKSKPKKAGTKAK